MTSIFEDFNVTPFRNKNTRDKLPANKLLKHCLIKEKKGFNLTDYERRLFGIAMSRIKTQKTFLANINYALTDIKMPVEEQEEFRKEINSIMITPEDYEALKKQFPNVDRY